MKTTDLASTNILIPNGTFFVELIIFFLLLFVVNFVITLIYLQVVPGKLD